MAASVRAERVGSGFWGFDETAAELSLPRRVRRTALVAAVWATAAAPALSGHQRCIVALLTHQPCPGCGMTRALTLLAAGRIADSMRMHPLALPVLAAGALLALATIWATFALGSPIRLRRTLVGRIAVAVAAAAYGATIALWVLRWFGLFGGPVPV